MKRLVIVAAGLGIATAALAGKEEREVYTKQVVPAMRAAEAAWKSSCGCALQISVDETSINETAEMHSTEHTCQEITDEVPKYCTDDASKKALCQMKTLVFK